MKPRSPVSLTLWLFGFAMLLSIGMALLQKPTKATAARTTAERVERLIRSLPDTTAARRLEIVADICSLMDAMRADSPFSMTYFGYDVTYNSDGIKTLKVKPDRNKVLSRVIPILINMIDDKEGSACKPWRILISLQGSCSDPKKATWQRWWQEAGSKAFKDNDQ